MTDHATLKLFLIMSKYRRTGSSSPMPFRQRHHSGGLHGAWLTDMGQPRGADWACDGENSREFPSCTPEILQADRGRCKARRRKHEDYNRFSESPFKALQAVWIVG